MKYLLTILFMLMSFVVNAQQDDYIYFTKQQHEQIKRNLEDYKTLIKQYDFQSAEFDKMKRQFELIKQLRTNDSEELARYKKMYLDLKNSDIQLANVIAENQKLKLEIDIIDKDRKYKERRMNLYIYRYNKELNRSKGERIFAGFFSGMIISATLISIYYAWEENHN